MNTYMETMRNEFIEQVKRTDYVLGAWNFGSEMHGLSDEYSDVDVVLLVEANGFDAVANSLDSYLCKISDEILLCWPEEFNSESIINNGYLLKKEDRVFQFDVFLLNSERLDDFMCRIHYMDLREDDIIFDKNGMVQKLMSVNERGGYWAEDVILLEQTYWYHANMTGKYLKRKDFFKLRNVMNTMFDTHASMILTGYDKITWGGSANKLHFIPEEKQNHLKRYYCSEDFEQTKENLLACMDTFQMDAKEIFGQKGLEYSTHIGDEVIRNWREIV